jgi:hypothetical protein
MRAGRLAGSLEISGRAVEVAMPYAYVIGERWDDTAGYPRGVLTVIDVSNPADLKRLGAYETAGAFSALAVSGGSGYVVTSPYVPPTGERPGTLQIIDLRNPSLPARLGQLSFTGYAQDVAVSGDARFWPTGRMA